MPKAHSFIEYIFSPMSYPVWWILGALLLLLFVIGFVTGIFVWTLPIEVLRTIPVIRTIAYRVLTFKFTRSLGRIARQHQAGQLDTREAFHQISRVFRLFIVFRTGHLARGMTATDVALSPALTGPALRVLELTYPGQFSSADPQGVAVAAAEAQRVVAAWV